MAASTHETCCVCGKKTAQRCGPCGAAGVTLLFCSRECQKLVHFAHKQVCGKNAKPFRFPPLSPDELTSAITYAPHRIEAGPGIKISLNERLKATVGCAEEDVPALLTDLASPDTPKLSPAVRFRALCDVRTFIHTRSSMPHDKHPNSAGARLSQIPGALGLLSLTASHLNHRRAYESPFYPVEEDWYIRLLHQVVVLGALTSLVFTPEIVEDQAKMDRAKEVAKLLAPASEPLRALILEVRKGDKDLARRICVALEDFEDLGCGPFEDLRPEGGENKE
ncbi:hypothetical protein JCM6882_009715 [Rhodosporidiobolus microsporus]